MQTQQRRIYDRHSVALLFGDSSPPKSSAPPIINIVDGPFVGDVDGGREDLPEPIINAPVLPDLVPSLEADESTSGLAPVLVEPYFPSADDRLIINQEMLSDKTALKTTPFHSKINRSFHGRPKARK